MVVLVPRTWTVENAARPHVKHVHLRGSTCLGQDERTCDVRSHRLKLVRLAPVDVGSASLTGAVDDGVRSLGSDRLFHPLMVRDVGERHDGAWERKSEAPPEKTSAEDEDFHACSSTTLFRYRP